MRVLVLGGRGFVGRAIVERLLQDGHEVYVLSRAPQPVDSQVHWLRGGLEEALTMALPQVEAVVNAAGELRDPLRMQAVNQDLPLALVERLAGQGGLHWVQLSSVGVYGPEPGMQVTESTPFAPRGPYETSKAEGELSIAERCAALGIHCSVLRPSNVFGEGMPNQSLRQLLGMVRRGLFFAIGEARYVEMNYVHVEDVARAVALLLAREAELGGAYIVNRRVSLAQVVATAQQAFGVRQRLWSLPESPLRIVARVGGVLPGFPLTASRIDALTNRAFYSPEKITRELGFKPAREVGEQLADYCRSLPR